MTLSIKTLRVKTFSVKTLSIKTYSIKTISIKTLSIKTLIKKTLSIAKFDKCLNNKNSTLGILKQNTTLSLTKNYRATLSIVK
jgi:hypothetical protein